MESKEEIASTVAPRVGGSYSQAIRAGDFVFLSGQTPRDRNRAIVDGVFAEHVRQTLKNLAAVAEAAGTSLDHAVKVNVYLRNWSDFDEMDRVYREYFSEPRPARTTVQSDIPVDVEVDAILWVGGTQPSSARQERTQ